MTFSEYSLYPGSAVLIKGLGLGYVTKITRGARPYHVTLVDGGKVYVCSFAHLLEPTDENKATAKQAYLDSLMDESAAFKELSLGTVCTLDGRPDYYVVIATVKSGKLKVAKLGGDGNRYVNAPIGMVTAVHASKVEVVKA
jgi:hypothetical protein